jgi:adenylate kinase family enzyme
MTYKIALMGTSGVGKTTLAKALASDLNIPVLEERLTDVYDAIKLINKKGNTHADIEENTKKLLEALRTWVFDRAKAQKENAGYICDRTALDILDILLSSSIVYNDEMIVGLIKEIRKQLNDLDLIVVLPIGEHTFQTPHNDDGLKRSVYLQHKLHSQAIKIGLLAMFSPKPTMMIEANVKSIDDRVELIKNRLLSIP